MTNHYSFLCHLLTDYGYQNSDSVDCRTFQECHLSFLQIRDRLIPIGTILHEDLDDNVYVVSIPSGFQNRNQAIVALQLAEGCLYAAGYAKEGVIHQRCLPAAWNQIEAIVHAQPLKQKTSIAKHIVTGILALVLVGTISMFFVGHGIHTSTQLYNEAIRTYNEQVLLYNAAAKLASVENIESLPSTLESIPEESENFFSNILVALGPNSKAKILADTDAVNEMTVQLKNATTSVEQITAPSSQWVMDRLQKIPDILDYEKVTEETDINQMLGKPGGYSDCIYFSTRNVPQADVPGNSITEKGTDAGGAIEIYPTLADANTRCDYLSGFDGTVLYSGSYAIVGTMVIRTSYLMSNQEQQDWTNIIVRELTAVL